MNTAVINIKTDPKVKTQVQKVAKELGMSVSGLVNGFFRHLIKEKTVTFSADEQLSPWAIKMLKQNEKDRKAGKYISFDSGEDAVAYLDNIIEQHGNKRKKN